MSHSGQKYERFDKLFYVGKPMQHLYVLHSGSAKAYIVSENGEEQIIGFYLAGGLFGFDGLNNYSHSCTLEILENGSVCKFPISDFEDLIVSSKQLRKYFLLLNSQTLIHGT